MGGPALRSTGMMRVSPSKPNRSKLSEALVLFLGEIKYQYSDTGHPSETQTFTNTYGGVHAAVRLYSVLSVCCKLTRRSAHSWGEAGVFLNFMKHDSGFFISWMENLSPWNQEL